MVVLLDSLGSNRWYVKLMMFSKRRINSRSGYMDPSWSLAVCLNLGASRTILRSAYYSTGPSRKHLSLDHVGAHYSRLIAVLNISNSSAYLTRFSDLLLEV